MLQNEVILAIEKEEKFEEEKIDMDLKNIKLLIAKDFAIINNFLKNYMFYFFFYFQNIYIFFHYILFRYCY